KHHRSHHRDGHVLRASCDGDSAAEISKHPCTDDAPENSENHVTEESGLRPLHDNARYPTCQQSTEQPYNCLHRATSWAKAQNNPKTRELRLREFVLSVSRGD